MDYPEKISVRKLELFYGDFQALNGITLPLKERQITALIGPSGCGKSTFLRCLNRMNDTIASARVSGEVLLDGQDIYAPDFDVVTLRQRVGMVFQRPNPFPQTIFDNVAFGPRVLGMHNIYRGSLNTSLIRLGEIFRPAIEAPAAALIMAHNHPSGDPAPSPEDVSVTRMAVEAGKLLDISVLDHLIIGQGTFTSLKERGLGFD